MCDEILENESLYRGRYRILRCIGQGGTGTVYMGFDEERGETVSIKRLKPVVLESPELLEGVRFETKLLGRLDHPGIPKLVAVYEDSFVMEHVPGNTLDKVLRENGAPSEKEVIRIGSEILEILEYLHGLKEPLIYRDLKPANIIIRPDGHVSLIDFGAARVYRTGGSCDEVNIGTCGFAAPEQYGSLGQTDIRTDVYCFGRTMEQMLIAVPRKKSGGKLGRAVAGGKCSPELQEIIDKCTRPDRDERYADCREILKALEKCPGRTAIRRTGRNLKVAVVAAVIALAVTVTATYYDTVMSYAAADAEQRIPAVRQRLGYAGIRIRDMFEREFEVRFK